MIRAKIASQTPGQPDTYLFGLTEENVKRLKDNKPVQINGTELGLAANILIIYGKDEKEIRKLLSPGITPETKIQIGTNPPFPKA